SFPVLLHPRNYQGLCHPDQSIASKPLLPPAPFSTQPLNSSPLFPSQLPVQPKRAIGQQGSPCRKVKTRFPAPYFPIPNNDAARQPNRSKFALLFLRLQTVQAVFHWH